MRRSNNFNVRYFSIYLSIFKRNSSLPKSWNLFYSGLDQNCRVNVKINATLQKIKFLRAHLQEAFTFYKVTFPCLQTPLMHDRKRLNVLTGVSLDVKTRSVFCKFWCITVNYLKIYMVQVSLIHHLHTLLLVASGCVLSFLGRNDTKQVSFLDVSLVDLR